MEIFYQSYMLPSEMVSKVVFFQAFIPMYIYSEDQNQNLELKFQINTTEFKRYGIITAEEWDYIFVP